MLPYQLPKLEVLSEGFGESRVHEYVRELRANGFLPTGEHASNEDICLLIYLLACTSSQRQIKKYIETFHLLHDASGKQLPDAFNEMLGYLSIMEQIVNVIYLREAGTVVITLFRDGREVQVPFVYTDNTPDTGVSSICMITGEWWRKLNNQAFVIDTYTEKRNAN